MTVRNKGLIPFAPPIFTRVLSVQPFFATVLPQLGASLLQKSRKLDSLSPPCLFVPFPADLENIFSEKSPGSLRRHQKTVKRAVEIGVSPSERKPVAAVTVGSVTISIYASPVTVRADSKLASAPASGAPVLPDKTGATVPARNISPTKTGASTWWRMLPSPDWGILELQVR